LEYTELRSVYGKLDVGRGVYPLVVTTSVRSELKGKELKGVVLNQNGPPSPRLRRAKWVELSRAVRRALPESMRHDSMEYTICQLL
jgi:hypothetical protein